MLLNIEKNLENRTKNVLKNGWRIRTMDKVDQKSDYTFCGSRASSIMKTVTRMVHHSTIAFFDTYYCFAILVLIMITDPSTFFSPFTILQNFSLNQAESVCRRQFQCYKIYQFCLLVILCIKHAWEREGGYQHFSFPSMFSRSLFIGTS